MALCSLSKATLALLLLILCLVRRPQISHSQFIARSRETKAFSSLATIRPECDIKTEFKCESLNKCIKKHQVCDGYVDCTDHSDEKDCKWCNETFSNDGISKRFLILSPTLLSDKTSCFYKITNMVPNTITSIRLKKFQVGTYNSVARECENSWFEIHETNSTDQIPSMHALPGKFCGSLLNFRNTYYSTGRYITLNLQHHTNNNKIKDPPAQFEFEVVFYPRHVLSAIGKNIVHRPDVTIDYGFTRLDSECDRIFMNCNKNPCLISSPGYPGIYLKNLKCLYRIENSSSKRNDKLILISDNLQLDGKLCHFEHADNGHLSSSYFCDTGLRSSHECLDTVSFQKKFVDSVCGIGQMNKIVTDEKALTIEFKSGASGHFANTGFLFYAIGMREYFVNYRKYNKLAGVEDDELNSIRHADRLQTHWCTSDQRDCTVQITEAALDYKEDNRGLFKIGYMYGYNQYHKAKFLLKYALTSTRTNTIAIYLNEYNPGTFSPTIADKCESHYLSISTRKPTRELSSIFKLCDPANLKNETVRLFLIKTGDPNNRIAGGQEKLSDVEVKYFSLNQALGKSELNDFKLSYEFLDFDWKNHETQSVCNFAYTYKNTQSGFIENPKASIFYRAYLNSEDNTLKCKYHLVAKANQYIKVTFEKIDFNVKDPENIYFKYEHLLKKDKCNALTHKLILKDSYYSNSKKTDGDELDTKMCFCQLNKINSVYISKTNKIELEYIVNLKSLGQDLRGVDFKLKYEFIDRGCDYLISPSLKTRNKGRIVYMPVNHLGTQKELNDDTFTSGDIRKNTEYKQFAEMIKDNLNFHCKFQLKAPKNNFIYIEFVSFLIGHSCNHNFIKLYNNYTGKDADTEDHDLTNELRPLISLCSLDKYTVNSDEFPLKNGKNNMITAFFSKDAHVSPSLSCYKSKNKVCFMTNELSHPLNPYRNQMAHTLEGSFKNELVIEILASNLEDFYYEIKYHYFEIDFPRLVNVQRPLRITNKVQTIRSGGSEYDGGSAKDDSYENTGGDLYAEDLGSVVMPFSCSMSRVEGTNMTLDISIDANMVCDNEVDCVYSADDEMNCPMVLGEGSILFLLFSVIVLTFLVLFCACIYRGWLMNEKKQKQNRPSISSSVNDKSCNVKGFKAQPYTHVKYSQGTLDDRPGPYCQR